MLPDRLARRPRPALLTGSESCDIVFLLDYSPGRLEEPRLPLENSRLRRFRATQVTSSATADSVVLMNGRRTGMYCSHEKQVCGLRVVSEIIRACRSTASYFKTFEVDLVPYYRVAASHYLAPLLLAAPTKGHGYEEHQ